MPQQANFMRNYGSWYGGQGYQHIYIKTHPSVSSVGCFLTSGMVTTVGHTEGDTTRCKQCMCPRTNRRFTQHDRTKRRHTSSRLTVVTSRGGGGGRGASLHSHSGDKPKSKLRVYLRRQNQKRITRQRALHLRVAWRWGYVLRNASLGDFVVVRTS